MPLEESRNYGMELDDKIETSVEQSENHEIELVVRKEPLLEEMKIFEAGVEQHENFESEPIKEETSLEQHENFESVPIKEETSLEQHENFESEPIKEETSLEQHEKFESVPIKEETSLEQHENFESEPIKEETSVEQHENFESELIKEETSVEQHKKHEPELVSREENVLEHHENHKGLFVREETVDQSENYKAELISMENTVVGQSENKEELVISSELIEHSKDCEVELVSTGETSVEQPKNYKTELIDRKETSIKHSDKYEVELVGGKQTQVNKKRKRKRQEDAKVVVKGEVRGERVTTVGVIGATRKNSTKNVGAAGDFEKESSLFGIMDTVKSFTQLVISSTVQGLFNAIFVPWQSESFTLPDQLSPVTNFISKIRKWQEKKRIMNKNKNTLEKFFSKNRLSSTTNKWPQALQNFSVEVQTYKKKKYNKIKWSLGIYVTDEEERRKVTINMEDVPSLENGVVYFKKNKSYMTSIKEPPADLPPALHKYWNQRHRLFYKFDEGIKLDHESWYSATPECIAVHHALRCACSIVVDAFCGAGGNAIQFAFSCSHVIAIDIDKAKIEIARHNAKVYGVADRIEFIVGDFFQLAPTLKADVVFLSPPWGGPEYLSSPVYDLANLSGDITASRLMEAAHKISHNVALFLPKNTNIKQLLCMGSRENRKISVEMNKIGRKPKALTVYYGDIADYWEEDL
ncbi:trimethylguanosine synthase 1 isoform X1 [Oratosquilla oratoria]|uniref:trimethylguanosine synthase 1 isoform X1 n=1 Tax=Oratosquilla oratoria TaxID=337810 RepID=UPI003F76D8DF